MKLTKGLLNAYKLQGLSDEAIQHILEIQEIVNIVKAWAQTEPISIHDDIELTHEQLEIRRVPVYRLINLIRDKTGINIGESS